jgi:hypothetical protein
MDFSPFDAVFFSNQDSLGSRIQSPKKMRKNTIGIIVIADIA